MASKKKTASRKKYDPFDDELVFVDGVWRKRRWAKNEKTKTYGWHVFGYREIVQATDRENQIESPRESRTKSVWAADKSEGVERPTVYITCPHCAAIMKVDKHRIKEDGEVDPCVVCPRKGCNRHVFMILRGWPYGRLEEIGGWIDWQEWENSGEHGVRPETPAESITPLNPDVPPARDPGTAPEPPALSENPRRHWWTGMF